jgi:hypothetical protein
VLVGTLSIVGVSGVFIVMNITDFKEGTKALILTLLYSINRRVLNR